MTFNVSVDREQKEERTEYVADALYDSSSDDEDNNNTHR